MKSRREEEERGKKRYRERLIQEEEAEQEIRNYIPEEDDHIDDTDQEIQKQFRP